MIETTIGKLMEAMKTQRVYRQSDGIMWTMRCPFHEEKTPSLSFNPHKGTYHCYGCAKMGSIDELPFKLED